MHPGLVRLTAGLLNVTGVGQLIGRRFAGRGAVFMLHSVVGHDTDFVDPFMQVRADFLDEMLAYLTSKGVDLISLDAAMQRIRQKDSKPFACFTLDDGYRDNLTVALPVFRRWNCPLTIYVTTALIEHRMPYEWGCLRELVAANDLIDIEARGLRLPAMTLAQKNRAFIRIHRMIRSGSLDDASCDALFRRHGIHPAALQERDALTEADLRTLARDRLVEIGGHTDTHRPLAQLTLDDARTDMRRNKAYLEAILERPVRHFAFPYGTTASCGVRESMLAAELGFHTAATTRLGCLSARHANMPTAWPRLHFRGGLQSRHVMECQRHGAIAALLSWLGRRDAIDGLAAS